MCTGTVVEQQRSLLGRRSWVRIPPPEKISRHWPVVVEQQKSKAVVGSNPTVR